MVKTTVGATGISKLHTEETHEESQRNVYGNLRRVKKKKESFCRAEEKKKKITLFLLPDTWGQFHSFSLSLHIKKKYMK